MTKNNLLNQWFWKWHVIAGLITLPIMLLLAITGAVYLFKDNVNNAVYQDTKFVTPLNHSQHLSLARQLVLANNSTQHRIVGVTLPSSSDQATAFHVAGKGRASNKMYVDPYTGEIKGQIEQKETFMYLVRKLHGELLLNQAGTWLIELVASWFIVLIITGLYIWWPKKNTGTAGFFTVRFSQGKRVLWRDLHAVIGFWLSAFMLIILAGGMPWTDVFGSQLKWVQQQTDTGYPQHWRNAKGLTSSISNTQSLTPLSLDNIVNIAESRNLEGTITVLLPTSAQGVYSIINRSLLLRDQQVIHLDQYSGNVIKALQWHDVGMLMDLRQIFMRLHQGEYGLVNWTVLLIVTLLFSMTTVAGLMSYLLRKPAGNWGIPRVPARFNVDKLLFIVIVLLGVVFPLFGISLVFIWGWERIKNLSLFQTSRINNE